MRINLKTVFKLLVTALVISMLFLVSSCDIQKSAQKSKTDTSLKYNDENRRYRQGDSVSYRPGKVVYKDTTIYRVSKQNTVLQTIYDKDGNIRDINCYAAQIEELSKRNFELEQLTKEKQSAKKENFDSTFILYIIGGVVVLGMFAFLLMFIYLKQNTNAILQTITK
jgi:hypothetical protein